MKFFKRTVPIIISVVFILSLVGCSTKTSRGSNYTIPMIDLSEAASNSYGEEFNSLYEKHVIDDSKDYLGHPDTVLLDDGELFTLYPEGHGKGALISKKSSDGGKTWNDVTDKMPKSWKNSMETPTIYKLNFNDGSQKIVMISGHPQWQHAETKTTEPGGGFNASFSNDDGKTFTEFKNYYGKNSEKYVQSIVAMSALMQLKDAKGAWQDKWMGIFHDHNFVNYKTYLTFENDGMQWSTPEPYFKQYEKLEKSSKMCEVELIRSESGKGDTLCLITRSNTKRMNSLISFSKDEGETWSEPKEVPSALSGERHKAEWLNDGRLFITFRSIEREKSKVRKNRIKTKEYFISEGWVAWVGTFDDLINGKEGQYRIKLAHTYYLNQEKPELYANKDTGYSGNSVLDDGTIFTCSYGNFSKFQKIYVADAKTKKTKVKLKTFIIGKKIDINLTDKIFEKIK